MKRPVLFVLVLALLPVLLQAQTNKPIYISLPGRGNVQHSAYAVVNQPGAKL